MKRCFVIILLCLNFPQISFSQSNFDINFYKDFHKTFYLNVVAFPNPDLDSADVLFVYRYSTANLTFEKVPTDGTSKLIATGLLEIVLRDSVGVIFRSFFANDTIIRYSETAYDENTYDVVGYVRVRLPLANFEIEASLFNRGNFKVKTLKTSFKETKLGNFSFFPPIFCSKLENKNFLHTVGAGFDFSKRDKIILFPVVATKSNFGKFFYRIKSIEEKTSRIQWNKSVDVSNELRFVSHFLPEINFQNGELELKFSGEGKSGLAESKLMFFEIPIDEKLAYPQKYKLSIFKDLSKSDSIEFDFLIVWERVPFSLRNVDYAINLASYVFDDKEIEELKAKKRDEKLNALFELWQKLDNDTTTLFNEAMEIYYNRVDFAYFNYQTVDEQDGAQTSRGKIYILFGKPDSVFREIQKDNVIVETWEYQAHRKKFVFRSKDGKFDLVEVINI